MTEAQTHRTWVNVAARLGCCIKTAKKRVKLYNIPVMKFGRFVELDEGIYQDYLRRVRERVDQRNHDTIPRGREDKERPLR